jgi:hypothetical protein
MWRQWNVAIEVCKPRFNAPHSNMNHTGQYILPINYDQLEYSYMNSFRLNNHFTNFENHKSSTF